MEVGGHQHTGRPEVRLSDVKRKEMKERGVNIEEYQYQRTRRLKTR